MRWSLQPSTPHTVPFPSPQARVLSQRADTRRFLTQRHPKALTQPQTRVNSEGISTGSRVSLATGALSTRSMSL